jgi:hypothetical protein
MHLNTSFIAVILLCTAVAFAGCSGTQNVLSNPASGSAPGSGTSGSASAGNLAPSPTDAIPDNDMIKVDIGEKDYLGVIPVIFQGGLGQIHVQKIEVTLYRFDGQEQSATIAANKGAEADLQGTKQTDRVVVYVTLNGVRYKTNDVLSPYRTRG